VLNIQVAAFMFHWEPQTNVQSLVKNNSLCFTNAVCRRTEAHGHDSESECHFP